jgi:hypothetical protein
VTQPRGRLSVNPEGVVNVGDAYDEHVRIYDNYLTQLASLRERYAKAWGDDDMGKQFSTKFLAGLDNLEGLIGGVRGTLQYTSEGLRQFGKAYAEADESALEVGHQMAADFDSLPAGGSSPAVPAISSYRMTPEYASARVGGEPLPEGYRLQALNPFPEGTTRVDANLYESITPLAGTPVTTADGRPLDPEDGQFFVVKENAVADPTAPGYQPLFLSFGPDGTPTPLITG